MNNLVLFTLTIGLVLHGAHKPGVGAEVTYPTFSTTAMIQGVRPMSPMWVGKGIGADKVNKGLLGVITISSFF